MNLQDTLFSAAVVAVAGLTFCVAAQAAPQQVVKLERVVVTGKAVREVVQLPRVVVTGYSEAKQLRNATLAAARTSTKRI